MNLEDAKRFIAEAEAKARELELTKARLEQQKEFAEKNLENNRLEMERFGCTPDTIADIIKEKEGKIKELREKIEGIFNKSTGEI